VPARPGRDVRQCLREQIRQRARIHGLESASQSTLTQSNSATVGARWQDRQA
jgi:hypothetical protein